MDPLLGNLAVIALPPTRRMVVYVSLTFNRHYGKESNTWSAV